MEFLNIKKAFLDPKFDSILWYSKNSFLHKMINNTLRSNDLIEIFQIRFFISKLSKDLKETEKIPDGGNCVLYRGTIVSMEEFKLWKENNTLMVNGFISTSKDKIKALQFMFNQSTIGFLLVLIKIIAKEDDKNLHKDISKIASIISESEHLININTFLKITKIINKIYNKETKSPAYIKIVCNFSKYSAVNIELSKKSEKYKKNIEKVLQKNYTSDIFYLAEIEDIKRFKMLENFKPRDEEEKRILFHFLGNYYKNIGDNEKAIEYYKKCLAIENTSPTIYNVSRASSLNNIGLVYNLKKKYIEAAYYFNESIQIYKNFKYDECVYASTLNNLALSHLLSENLDVAINLFEESKKKYEQLLKIHHPDYAALLNNIGLYHEKKSEFDKGMIIIKRV